MFMDQRFLKSVWKLSTGDRSISTVPAVDIAIKWTWRITVKAGIEMQRLFTLLIIVAK